MEIRVRHHEKVNVHQVSVRPHTEKLLLTEILVRCDITLPVAAKNSGVFSVGVRAKTHTFSSILQQFLHMRALFDQNMLSQLHIIFPKRSLFLRTEAAGVHSLTVQYIVHSVSSCFSTVIVEAWSTVGRCHCWA